MWYVYKHENLITHQSYIGITKQQPEIRWGKYGRGYRKQTKFFNAILEYGWKNFSHEILFQNIVSEEEARTIETELIVKYNTVNNGYNSIVSIQEHNENPKQYKRNIQYIDINTNKIYSSMADIAQDLNISRSAVSKYFSKENLSCGGHIILEKDYYDSLPTLEKNKLLQKITTPKIKCVETNEIFDTAELAGKRYSDKSGAKSYILRACRNGTTAYRKHWIFI